MTNAIFLLCYGNDYYLTGLLCALYAHQKLKPKHVKIVVLCDKVIMQYHKIIKPFCDRIIEIKQMFSFKDLHKTIKNKKYAKPWINYIVNRWHCLQFTEYKKILMFDIDMLPTKKSLYDIFNKYDNNDFVFTARKEIIVTNKFDTLDKIDIIPHYENYNDFVLKSIVHIDTDMILITPDKQLHTAYFSFLKSLKKTKIETTFMGNIDESSFLYFISNLSKKSYRCFDKEDYWIIPWHTFLTRVENHEDQVMNSKCIRFISEIKPFTKPPNMYFRPEDKIWNAIEMKLMFKHQLLELLYIRNCLFAALLYGNFNYRIIGDDSDNIGVLIIQHKLKSLKININHSLFKENAYKSIVKFKKILLSFKDEIISLNDGINLKEFGVVPYSCYELILKGK